MRGLAHPAHWQGPLGSTFERFGAVKATPRAAFRLLQAGEAVLLFPGGGREVRRTVASPHPLDISRHLGSQVSWPLFTARVRAALCGLCMAAEVVALSTITIRAARRCCSSLAAAAKYAESRSLLLLR